MPKIGNEIGSEIGPARKIGKNQPQNRKSGENPIFGLFFSFFRAGPISKPISFPVLGRRPKTYFLAGRRGRNSKDMLENGVGTDAIVICNSAACLTVHFRHTGTYVYPYN